MTNVEGELCREGVVAGCLDALSTWDESGT